MLALRLRFPAGRYHATPWGRHVNEAAVAWPPEPARILRALIACHHRKADKAQFSTGALADLIDALAGSLPLYRLPLAVHAHTRHYMPSPVKTTLVFDAFARFDPEDPLIVGWPDAALGLQQRAHLDHLAAGLGYLGRAESWVAADVIEWDGEGANAWPVHSGSGNDEGRAAQDPDCRLTSLYAPLSPNTYRERRERLIRDERERRRASWMRKAKPTDKALDKDMKGFLATLPERLADALAVDTSDLQAVGWSDPPASQRVLYAAPEPTTVWRGKRRQQAKRTQLDPTVARFVLAGRPRPRIEDTLRIAETARLALMSKFKGAPPPLELSGRDDIGPLRSDPAHAHAFYLPEDADGDGLIDHLIVYCRQGFSGKAQRALDGLTQLWLAHGRADEEGERGRKEWRLALEDIAAPEAFSQASALLGCSRAWKSVTPYLMPWHAKRNFGVVEQITREIERRGTFPRLTNAVPDQNALPKRAIKFHRIRSRRGLVQPDRLGCFLTLTFVEPVIGPLALGFACHYGLGLFRSAGGDRTP